MNKITNETKCNIFTTEQSKDNNPVLSTEISSDELFKQLLRQHNMEVVECGGEGDCLIHSIIRQVPLQNREVSNFRQGVAAKMQEAYRVKINSAIEELKGLSDELNLISSILEKDDKENRTHIDAAHQDIDGLLKKFKEANKESAEAKWQEFISKIEWRESTSKFNKSVLNENYYNNFTLKYCDEISGLATQNNEEKEKNKDIFQRMRSHVCEIEEQLAGGYEVDFSTLLKEVQTSGKSLNLGEADLYRGILQHIKDQLNQDKTIMLFTETTRNNAKTVTDILEMFEAKECMQLALDGKVKNDDEAKISKKFEDKENHIFLYYEKKDGGSNGHYKAIIEKN